MTREQQIPNADPATHECDVLVIGGGPAGSTIGALLAERGHRITILEKAHHPRFHIGESLLPANLPLLQQLGVAQEVDQIGMKKWGAEFNSPYHTKKRETFLFADAWDKSMPMAYQVRRADFDDILFRNARKKGATTIEGCRARSVEFLPHERGAIVHALREDGSTETWKARFLVDASGRDTFLGTCFKIKRNNPKHNSSALYAHFRGAHRLPASEEGHISLFWFEHGWFWFIPLADGTTSVGAVVWPSYLKTRKKPVEDFFADTIAMSPELAMRLADARRVTDVEATGNYAYICAQTHGESFLMLGDAFAFYDPVFSSGVMLAMQSAFIGADTIDICLRQPRRAAAALRHFDRKSRHGGKVFSWYIYRITQPALRDMFMYPGNPARTKEAVLSVLAGDIFNKTPIWTSLRFFKMVYYLMSIRHLGRSWAAYKKRKKNIRI
ncbi:NAD(P)/FAD-dependent oxidoreductase [Acidithiobacillus ferriphilus]|jgi:flavin-dependent dehydrogenase|uniref:NAD(P)/FAD-dependent oxidoreductase n=1 Tax=Acidithiobacillus ferriphilus TaxID=1689834 RepID=UPI001C065088|nr:NAD(P)/FAD-dependent oxidoreductase [Acidithiobacillus ferriphilus]MDA8182231.1 NAD(P)/FAD-dependent oxidoreductase [Acidithiobacillus sp.]MBU2831056.1 NAD(P)/FAD-dependent oxidoreductase [Acidithiobacillus ferriphilus]MBU2833664.1 NAD(P)/FAD-dependent oxidoreductase [Acidithiobacillus ferriphilus]MBU2854230.1 NAD(P)/FAD-dependent oxidoreductase [Acidithiobacillus ferriphilus]MBW9250188.1 NAD(P)-binding protein [Acidithiobacillus ferriphilus]